MNMPVITTASKTENGEPGIPRDERTPPRDTLIELLAIVEGDKKAPNGGRVHDRLSSGTEENLGN